jgi:hypothetical protein
VGVLLPGGQGKTSLTPPPVAQPSRVFQTVSLEIVPFDHSRWVPPQASTCGLEAGKSTLARCAASGVSSVPWSPAEQQIVTPRTAASWQTAS